MADLASCDKNPSLTCWVCKQTLVENCNRDTKIVTSVCGHVLHKKCLKDWYEACKKFECPVCKKKTSSDVSIDLFFDLEENDYEILQEEIEELRIANIDQKKQLTVAQIKLMLLGSNNQELNEEFSSIKWKDLTSSFQIELMKKLQMGLTDLDIGNVNLEFLSSEFLIRVIRTKKPDHSFLPKFLNDYYKHLKSESNPTLLSFLHIFKTEVLAKLKDSCNIPDLDPAHVPVSPQVLLWLSEDSSEGKNMLIKIIEMYLMELPSDHISCLCRFVLLKLMSEDMDERIIVRASFVTEPALYDLMQAGIIKWDNGYYATSKDYIRYYIVGLLLASVRQALNLDKESARHLFYGGASEMNSLQHYFTSYFENMIDSNDRHDEQCRQETLTLKQTFRLDEGNNVDRVVLLAVTKIRNENEFAKIFGHLETYCNEIRKNIWDISHKCFFMFFYVNFSLLEFAAVRGDLNIMRKLYSLSALAGREDLFDVGKLVRVHCSGTLSIGEDEISQRKDFLSFLLSLYGSHDSVEKVQINVTPKTVHFELLKFVMEHGYEIFDDIWNVLDMVGEVRPYIRSDQFFLLSCSIFRKTNLFKVLQIYCSARATPV